MAAATVRTWVTPKSRRGFDGSGLPARVGVTSCAAATRRRARHCCGAGVVLKFRFDVRIVMRSEHFFDDGLLVWRRQDVTIVPEGAGKTPIAGTRAGRCEARR